MIHKSTFKQKYKNYNTGEEINCCTNRIEAAWEISKDHFRRIHGTSSTLFEEHSAEVVWKNHTHRHGNVYASIFDLVKSIYPLDMEPQYMKCKPIFRTWAPQPKKLRKGIISLL